MKTLERFTFDIDFEQEIEEERIAQEEAAKPKEPTFTLSEFEDAKKQAFEEGRQQGLDEAKQSLEAQIQVIVQQLNSHCQKLFEDHSAVLEAISQENLAFTTATLRKILPEYISEHGDEEIIAIVQKALAYAVDHPEITIAVAEENREPIEKRIKELPALGEFDGNVNVVGQPELSSSECTIKWGTQSGAERRITEVLSKLDDIVQGAFPADTEQQPESEEPQPETSGDQENEQVEQKEEAIEQEEQPPQPEDPSTAEETVEEVTAKPLEQEDVQEEDENKLENESESS